MKCPFCGFAESKVIDSRPAEEGATIRRRRECLACQKRFTTYEIIETLPLVVIKRDGSRQSFDKSKLINGMVRACDKRKVPLPVLEKIADEIEQELQSALEREITTEQVGEMVMKRLKDVDEVAYVRFASVYRHAGTDEAPQRPRLKHIAERDALPVGETPDAQTQQGNVRRGGRCAALERTHGLTESFCHGVCALMRQHTVGIALGCVPAFGRSAQRFGGAVRVMGGTACFRLRRSVIQLRAEPVQIPDVADAAGGKREQERARNDFLFHIDSFAEK